MILWMEQWVNHTTQCPTCQQQQDGTFSIADEPEN
jgi:DNA-binding helix-hairpin-helix protein with protein kinase domain